MLSRLSSHVRHNVVGYLALFFALSGTALGANAAIKVGDPASGDLTGTYPGPTIAPNKVDSGKVLNNSLTAADLAAGAVVGGTGGTVQDNTLSTEDVLNQSLTADDLAAGSVGTSELGDGAVTPAKLNAGLQFTDSGLPLFLGDCSAVPHGWYAFADTAALTSGEVSYARDAFGIVHLHGVAVNCSAPNDLVFTLPPGFRPKNNPIFPGLDYNNPALNQITINTDGDVFVYPVAGGRSVIPSLEGVTFRCWPSGQNGCP